MRKIAIVAAAMAIACTAGPARGTVLTFEGLNLSNEEAIPAGYGDNVAALACDAAGRCCDALGCYAEGNGFTPNVTVEYRALDPWSGATELESLSYWDADYGDLSDLAYAGSQGLISEITLVPEDGFDVILNGFDLAGWPNSTVPDQSLRIIDVGGTVLFDLSPINVRGEGSHTSIVPALPIVSAQGLKIRFGSDWRVGIDNVSFDQAETGSSGECGVDAVCREELNATTTSLLACQDTLQVYELAMAALQRDLAACTEELATLPILLIDADQDRVSNCDDRCPDTTAGASVDSTGCTLEQFCARVDATTRSGKRSCKRLDWKDDGSKDCAVEGDRCVPASP